MLQAVYENIIEALRSREVPYEEITHDPVHSTDDSAKVRKEAGWNEGIGSKNIVFHAKGNFYLVVTVARKNIKARRFKKEFGTKDIRFATPDEVGTYTGCSPGAIPPFGHTHPELPIYVDKEILEHPYFMFNPGIHTKSLRIQPEGLIRVYQSIANPVKLFVISEDDLACEELKKEEM